jgi:anthranilate synthase component II
VRALMIDNYDSFTYNLVQYLGQLKCEVEVKRNDALTAEEAISTTADCIVISPGPSTPEQAGICIDLIKLAAKAGKPLLGVCLGHQSIGAAFGARVLRAPLPMHGKVSLVTHQSSDIFAGIPSPFNATRYHSLIIDDLPAELIVTASTADNIVMAVRHATLPIFGIQFHPESVMTEHGLAILKNFIEVAAKVRSGGKSLD